VKPNLLLIEDLPLADSPEERRALGLPRDFPTPSPGTVLLRLERVGGALHRRLSVVAGESGALDFEDLPSRSPTDLVLAVPPGKMPGLLRRLRRLDAPLPLLAEEVSQALRFRRRFPVRLRLARRSLTLGRRTLILGILNVTPDSFHDGGRWQDPGLAAERAFRMVEEGADIVDIGGESTRPGSHPIGAGEEIRRIIPIVERLSGRLRAPISVDTTKSEVAEAALGAGAELVNDISGLRFDPRLARACARSRAALIVSHLRGRPRTMHRNPRYRHLLPEVVAVLRRAVEAALGQGISRESIMVDPGIGFGKRPEHNLLLLRHLPVLRSIGCPVLIGASRKSFIGAITGEGADGRLAGSLAAAALAVFQGASALRVHDVQETVRVARVAEAIRDARLRARRT